MRKKIKTLTMVHGMSHESFCFVHLIHTGKKKDSVEITNEKKSNEVIGYIKIINNNERNTSEKNTLCHVKRKKKTHTHTQIKDDYF